jgi:hypothetical protein
MMTVQTHEHMCLPPVYSTLFPSSGYVVARFETLKRRAMEYRFNPAKDKRFSHASQ